MANPQQPADDASGVDVPGVTGIETNEEELAADLGQETLRDEEPGTDAGDRAGTEPL